MKLSVREQEKLMIVVAADLAKRPGRAARGLRVVNTGDGRWQK